MTLSKLLAVINVAPSDLHINQTNPTAAVANALNLVFGVAGAVAVIIIAIAGLKYVVSQGNPQETAKAKDTILYAIVGLVICMLAFTITSFVAGRL